MAFTVRLWDHDEVDEWELVRGRLRRELQRTVDKTEMLRALMRLASRDETVRAALVEELRARDAST